MNGRQMGSGVLAGLVMFGLSGLYHTVLFADVFASDSGVEPAMVVIALAFVVLGLVMAMMYPTGYKGGPGVGEGIRFGALIGFLWIAPFTMILVAVGEATWTIFFYDVPYHIIEGAIGGAIIAKMYRGGAA